MKHSSRTILLQTGESQENKYMHFKYEGKRKMDRRKVCPDSTSLFRQLSLYPLLVLVAMLRMKTGKKSVNSSQEYKLVP